MKILFTSIVLLITGIIYSQTADEYYHGSANYYINGNYHDAKKNLAEGIIKYPEDKRLRAIAELINEDEQEQRKQQDQNQQGQQQDQKEQEQQQQQDQKEQEQQQEQQQQQQQQDQDKEGGQKQEQKAVPVQQISREDAERLLQIIEAKEKETLQKLQEKKAKGRKVPVEKEW